MCTYLSLNWMWGPHCNRCNPFEGSNDLNKTHWTWEWKFSLPENSTTNQRDTNNGTSYNNSFNKNSFNKNSFIHLNFWAISNFWWNVFFTGEQLQCSMVGIRHSLAIVVHLHSSLQHELVKLHCHAVAAYILVINSRSQPVTYDVHCSALYYELPC